MGKTAKAKLIFISLGIVLVAAFSIGFYMHYTTKDATVSSTDEYDPSLREVGIESGWTTTYNSLRELTEDSDFIGLVEITAIVGVEKQNPELPSVFGMMPYTIYTAEVLTGVLAAADTIEILMTGKRDEDGSMQVIGDPLMSEGERWFIFASENYDGSYTILSGPYGRFSYDEANDTVTSLLPAPDPSEISAFSILDTDTNTIERIRDVSLSDLREQVLSYLE